MPMHENAIESLSSFAQGLTRGHERVSGLTGTASAALLSLCQEDYFVLERTDERAGLLAHDISFYLGLSGHGGPSQDTGPSRGLSGHGGPVLLPAPVDAESRGLRAKVSMMEPPFSVVTTGGAFEEGLWPGAYLLEAGVRLALGESFDRDVLAQKLLDMGYLKVALVTGPGQFSTRGYILDLYPPCSDHPVRAEFFGDDLEGLRAFDVANQRSVEELDEIAAGPAMSPPAEHEVPVSALSKGRLKVIFSDVLEDDRGLLPSWDLELSRFAITGRGIDAPVLSISGLGVLYNERSEIYDLPRVLNALSSEERVMLVATSTGQAERLREIFADESVTCPVVPFEEAGTYEGRLFIVQARLSAGLRVPGLMVLTERELFGGRPAHRPIRRTKVAELLAKVEDLASGDLVVYAEKGIGRFVGLVHEEIEGTGYDLLALEYMDGDRIYLPLDAIDEVRKYRAEEGKEPKLDSLRTKRWQQRRERVMKRVRQLAEKLLRLYAGRELIRGRAFSPEAEMHSEFREFFPYEATPDQLTAIAAIAKDMEAEKPMDRLLCGDVGYGKTEVAMRAAFKAVYDGAQVAVLVPTTLLCEQHERVFKQRFSAFPVKIGALSRFRTTAQKREVLKKLASGKLDIVIATHSLLRKDLSFRDLGLLIIDEEHRFGVGQKERIKDLSLGVDVLTLSATPIPRTLQMSLTGIRGMSLIETPPEERLAVVTEVASFDMGLIKDALEAELDRGGQAFVVHNRVRSIMKLYKALSKAVPQARIAVAHGQMPERELERVMLDFLDGRIDVLLSTAIVGSGLDIPNANTMIVDQAHMMGLADLYQLKGRVGRGDRRAYAWFLVPDEDVITDEASKRLQALVDMSYMGAGFRLAMKDLEIRGAGNMLGSEQSGSIDAVGFDLYMEMLEEAVSEIRGQKRPEKLRPAMNLRVNAYLPESYLDEMSLRLSAYRSISGAGGVEELRAVAEEFADRYGPLPEPAENLLAVRELAIMAAAVGAREVTQRGSVLRLSFTESVDMRAERVMEALGSRGLKFHPGGFEVTFTGNVLFEARELLAELSNLLNN